jgi:hypothetical protein
MQSHEIEGLLTERRAQREQIGAQLEDARTELARVQAAFNAGDATLESLTAATSQMNAIETAAARLSSEITSLESQLAATQQQEYIHAGQAALCEIAEQANQTWARYLEALAQAQSAIEAHANQVRASIDAHRATRLEFLNQLQRTPALPSDLGETDLTGIGVSLHGISIAAFDRGWTVPTSPFGELLLEAMAISDSRDPAAIAARQAEANERQQIRRDAAEAEARIAQERADEEAMEAERLEREAAESQVRIEAAIARGNSGRTPVLA